MLDINCKNKHAYMISIVSKHAYKLKIILRISLPLFVNHQQRGENKSNNKDIYVIYIHEEERR